LRERDKINEVLRQSIAGSTIVWGVEVSLAQGLTEYLRERTSTKDPSKA